MYKHFFRKIFFLFDPEFIHEFISSILSSIFKFSLIRKIIKLLFYPTNYNKEIEIFGLKFKNPIGLGAGFDKNAKLFYGMHSLGFGFMEIGTITPLAQDGNPKKRMFRLPKDEALINRMGFNNKGVDYVVNQLQKHKKEKNFILGGNIGKNKLTPNELAYNDYIICYNKLYDYVDYFVINVSSPNTPNLRELQEASKLNEIFIKIQEINQQKPNPKPILVKIAPDINNELLDEILYIIQKNNIDGIVVSNTSVDRNELNTNKDKLDKIGDGGLSGKPICKKSTQIVKYISHKTEGKLPIIAVGGVFNKQDYEDKINAGASLVQLFTGYVYEGPNIIKKILT